MRLSGTATATALTALAALVALAAWLPACANAPAAPESVPPASPTTSSPAAALPRGALPPGTYATTATRRAFRLAVARDGWTSDGETADGFTLRIGSAALGVLAFAPGETSKAALLRAFRTTPGLTKSADEVTRPVDGNPAWHLTWRTTRDVRLTVGGHPLAFAKGERNHVVVVDAPRAPVLVLMAATDADFGTVYDEGHMLVFAMGIGP